MSADMPQEVSGNKHLRTLQKPFELEPLLAPGRGTAGLSSKGCLWRGKSVLQQP